MKNNITLRSIMASITMSDWFKYKPYIQCWQRGCECNGCYYNEIKSLKCKAKKKVKELLKSNFDFTRFENRKRKQPNIELYRYLTNQVDSVVIDGVEYK